MYESTPDYCRISLLHATAHRSSKQHLPFSPEMVTFSDPIVSRLFQVIHSVSTFLSCRIGYREWHPPKNFQAPSTSPILELHPSQLSLAFALLSCVNPSSILSYYHPAPSGLQLPHSIVFATTKPSRAATTLSLFQAASTLNACLSCIQTLTPSSLILAAFASSLILSCIRPARSSELHPPSCSFELHSHSVARSSCAHPYAHSSGIHPPRSSEMHPLTCLFELHSPSARFELHPPFMLVFEQHPPLCSFEFAFALCHHFELHPPSSLS